MQHLTKIGGYELSTASGYGVCLERAQSDLMVMSVIAVLAVTFVAEQLRLSIKKISISHKNHLLPKVTVSIGVSTLPDQYPSGLALLRAADEALYRAKERGRDRVVVAQEQPSVSANDSFGNPIRTAEVAMIEGPHEGAPTNKTNEHKIVPY